MPVTDVMASKWWVECWCNGVGGGGGGAGPQCTCKIIREGAEAVLLVVVVVLVVAEVKDRRRWDDGRGTVTKA